MKFPAVHWHEGLFLQPHHFQAWDRHWSERVSTSERWQNPHGYGLQEIDINHSALSAGFLQIDSLKGKTPGGLLVEFQHSSHMERRDLRPALSLAAGTAARFVDVYLAVPNLHLGGKNVESMDQHRNGSRFRTESLEFPDETDATSIQPIEFKRLNARILLSNDDLAGYDVLKIARIRQSEQDSAVAQLDAAYIPPLMDIAAWPTLRHQILLPIYDLIQQQSERLAEQVRGSGGTLHIHSAMELQRLVALQTLNPASAALGVIVGSRGIHPLTAYIELSRLAGATDLFHEDRFAKRTSEYDHERIGPLFLALKHRIFQSLEGLATLPYRQMNFVGMESGMTTTLDQESIKSCTRWLLGVHRGNASHEQLKSLLSAAQLDWKLGSARQVDRIFVHREPGIELRPAPKAPASLPQSDQWSYFTIEALDQPAWKDVLATGTMAMRIRDTLLVDPVGLPGSGRLKVMLGRDVVTLEFALFGVR
jgi:type VI secretion system protein ImpJ